MIKQAMLKRVEDLERRSPQAKFGCDRCCRLPFLTVHFVPDAVYFRKQAPPTERCPSCERMLVTYWAESVSKETPQQVRDREILAKYNPLFRRPNWRESIVRGGAGAGGCSAAQTADDQSRRKG